MRLLLNIPEGTFLQIQTDIYAHNTSPYICVTNEHVYMGLQKVVTQETPNYTVSNKPFHVR